ncbi:hypothetical protein MSUIS_00960 [Mycoplasma suis KI3806]|uniref:Uncharacterized protein n=1 Tax=Mycoplasma suis (strain KI_3806) TaxID=708248 RepID=F0V2W7_MYCS3|nr:hypothetical protein [Mycoplasma suis]CBZ40189.1 hypothetical protein MSUIS_00960 [Mycoplasma suis KI3806]
MVSGSYLIPLVVGGAVAVGGGGYGLATYLNNGPETQKNEITKKSQLPDNVIARYIYKETNGDQLICEHITFEKRALRNEIKYGQDCQQMIQDFWNKNLVDYLKQLIVVKSENLEKVLRGSFSLPPEIKNSSDVQRGIKEGIKIGKMTCKRKDSEEKGNIIVKCLQNNTN